MYTNVNKGKQKKTNVNGQNTDENLVPSRKREKAEKVVNFRLTPTFFEYLEKFARANQDRMGRELSVGQAAGQIVVDALNAWISSENQTSLKIDTTENEK